MELKQTVRECGTINGFNYAYCKLLAKQAEECLYLDFWQKTGKNTTTFQIDLEWIAKLKREVQDHESMKDKNGDKIEIILIENSILESIFKNLESQTKIPSPTIEPCPAISETYDMLENRLKNILVFVKTVKQFLAIFE